MKRPFLTIVTRCCWRPVLLAANVQSVLRQTDRDIEQIFIVDQNRRGIHWANLQLFANRDRVGGEWVYILDDDCRLIRDDFVSLVRNCASANPNAKFIVVKSRRPQLAPRVLPKPGVWGKRGRLPMRANCLCYVVRRELWREAIASFGAPAAGAGLMMEHLAKSQYGMVWLDVIVAETQQLGRGRNFETCRKTWWRETIDRFGIRDVGKGDWRLRLWRQK